MNLMSGGPKMRFGHIKKESKHPEVRLSFGFTHLPVQKAVEHHHHKTLENVKQADKTSELLLKAE